MFLSSRTQISVYIFIVITLTSCRPGSKQEKQQPGDQQNKIIHTHALLNILESGKLKVLTDYNSTSYFIYRGKPMGFHYELMKKFAEHLDVSLEIEISKDLDTSFQKLINAERDLIGLDLTVTKERSEIIDFTDPIIQTKQVLIQRKPEGWQHMSKKEMEKHLIRNQLNLAGLNIYVQKSSSFAERLRNLSDEIGKSINIIEKDELQAEQLISMVAKGEIDYTIADGHIAMVNKTYYPNLDIETEVSFPQNIGWGIHKGSNELEAVLNTWLNEFKETKEFTYLYNKYFRNPKSTRIVESEFYSKSSGKISRFDGLIKKYAKEIDWDWRLLASLIYQESRFHPEVRSWAGAFGLMQLMPTTAARFGADTSSPVSVQIKAGVGYIKYLDDHFKTFVDDEEERIKFILAAYNTGLGHVMDARRLADKYGKDSNIWNRNVDTFLLLKSTPKYYRDPVVKYGYSRGEEPYNFVRDITERYQHYKSVIN